MQNFWIFFLLPLTSPKRIHKRLSLEQILKFSPLLPSYHPSQFISPNLLPIHERGPFPPDTPEYTYKAPVTYSQTEYAVHTPNLLPKHASSQFPPVPDIFKYEYHHPPTYPPYHSKLDSYAPKPLHPPPLAHPPLYELPKFNCTLEKVTEEGEVCIPLLTTVCETIPLARKSVVDKDQCYTTKRTICKIHVEKIENKVCTITERKRIESTNAKTVDISFIKECTTQSLTVCQPAAYGPRKGYERYPYHPHEHHNYCKDVQQITCYNVPVVTVIEPEVEVFFPEQIETCENKDIDLPRITCENITEEKCITVPEIEEVTEDLEVCKTILDEPNCQISEHLLPKQSCSETDEGYALRH